MSAVHSRQNSFHNQRNLDRQILLVHDQFKPFECWNDVFQLDEALGLQKDKGNHRAFTLLEVYLAYMFT